MQLGGDDVCSSRMCDTVQVSGMSVLLAVALVGRRAQSRLLSETLCSCIRNGDTA